MKSGGLHAVVVLAGTIAILGPGASLSFAGGTAEVAQAIQEQYNAKNEAIAKKDMAAVWKLRTRDYTDVSDGTGRGVAELQPKQALLFEKASSLQGTSKVENVTLSGTTAVVRVRESGTMIVPNPQVGQDVVMMNEGVWLETWVLDNGQWLTRQSKVLTNSITINGKPVPN
ncbi:MAG: hypothetical protein HY343_09550 [Lentisphaerae bacterium]|nr:hypothetical protein [Lentisphaerota bacterium]